MSIDIDRLLVETAQRVAITRNEFGDIVYGGTTTVACLYRDISTLQNVPNREETGIDGILWFGATEPVARGSVYYHPSEGYLRVVRITKAKRLLVDDTTQFIRCQVQKIRQVS